MLILSRVGQVSNGLHITLLCLMQIHYRSVGIEHHEWLPLLCILEALDSNPGQETGNSN
jgi:hypothetical protein